MQGTIFLKKSWSFRPSRRRAAKRRTRLWKSWPKVPIPWPSKCSKYRLYHNRLNWLHEISFNFKNQDRVPLRNRWSSWSQLLLRKGQISSESSLLPKRARRRSVILWTIMHLQATFLAKTRRRNWMWWHYWQRVKSTRSRERLVTPSGGCSCRLKSKLSLRRHQHKGLSQILISWSLSWKVAAF